MRAFVLLLFVFASAPQLTAQGQSPAGGAHGLVVVKHDWSKERVGWEQDPFGGPVLHFDQVRVRARDEKRLEDAKRGGNSMEADRARRDMQTDAAIIESTRRDGPPRYAFLYKLTVRNDGAKPVKTVDWDYVFQDAATREEVGRREFTSDERVAPGKSKELKVFIPLPPTRTVSVQSLNQKERDSIVGSVRIVRVVYADGTVWQQAGQNEVTSDK